MGSELDTRLAAPARRTVDHRLTQPPFAEPADRKARPTAYGAPRITTQFCPPKPNALTIAVRTRVSRAVLAT
jgi:hypothetical protein